MRNLILGVAAFAFMAPVLAVAEPQDPAVVSVAVRRGDLNLRDPSDAAVMLGRLNRAALEACGGSAFSLPDYRWAVERSPCFKGAVASAVAQLNTPAVSHLYQNRGAMVLASN